MGFWARLPSSQTAVSVATPARIEPYVNLEKTVLLRVWNEASAPDKTAAGAKDCENKVDSCIVLSTG